MNPVHPMHSTVSPDTVVWSTPSEPPLGADVSIASTPSFDDTERIGKATGEKDILFSQCYGASTTTSSALSHSQRLQFSRSSAGIDPLTCLRNKEGENRKIQQEIHREGAAGSAMHTPQNEAATKACPPRHFPEIEQRPASSMLLSSVAVSGTHPLKKPDGPATAFSQTSLLSSVPTPVNISPYQEVNSTTLLVTRTGAKPLHSSHSKAVGSLEYPALAPENTGDVACPSLSWGSPVSTASPVNVGTPAYPNTFFHSQAQPFTHAPQSRPDASSCLSGQPTCEPAAFHHGPLHTANVCGEPHRPGRPVVTRVPQPCIPTRPLVSFPVSGPKTIPDVRDITPTHCRQEEVPQHMGSLGEIREGCPEMARMMKEAVDGGMAGNASSSASQIESVSHWAKSCLATTSSDLAQSIASAASKALGSTHVNKPLPRFSEKFQPKYVSTNTSVLHKPGASVRTMGTTQPDIGGPASRESSGPGGGGGGGASALSVLTQNVLGHAREFQVLARTAASSLLGAGGGTSQMRAALLDDTAGLGLSFPEGSGPLGLSFAEAVKTVEFLEPFNSSSISTSPNDTLTQNDERATSSVCCGTSQRRCWTSTRQRYVNWLASAPCSFRLPLLGNLQMGWAGGTCDPPTVGTWLVRCHACAGVYTLFKKNAVTEWKALPFLLDIAVLSHLLEPPCFEAPQHRLLVGEKMNCVLKDVVATIAQGSVTPFFIWGQLICTNYRIFFWDRPWDNSYETVLGTQWTYLSGLWNIPLACIHKLLSNTTSSKEKNHFFYLQKIAQQSASTPDTTNHIRGASNAGFVAPRNAAGSSRVNSSCSKRPEVFSVEIITKDGRHLRFLVADTHNRERQVLSHLATAVFEPPTGSLFAFQAKSPSDGAPYVAQAGHAATRTATTFAGYDAEKELTRLIRFQTHTLRISHCNSQYGLCPTYPKLLVVPRRITDATLLRVAPFRCKRRLPVLSWAGEARFGTLWRCSQPKSMFQRCVEDEELLTAIAELSAFQRHRHLVKTASSFLLSSSSTPLPPLLILDARPLINAVVNKASGAGFENTSSHYKHCKIEFAGIENIHHVRDAWKKMVTAIRSITVSSVTLPALHTLAIRQSMTLSATDNSDNLHHHPILLDGIKECPSCKEPRSWNQLPGTPWQTRSGLTLCCNPFQPLWVYGQSSAPLATQNTTPFSVAVQQLGASAWYDHIQRILLAANLAISQLSQGEAVIIHCSDGWDRTAQLTSLAMLCMDPYYRTLEGFATLIEQEFLYGGHQFHLRCGYPRHYSPPNGIGSGLTERPTERPADHAAEKAKDRLTDRFSARPQSHTVCTSDAEAPVLSELHATATSASGDMQNNAFGTRSAAQFHEPCPPVSAAEPTMRSVQLRGENEDSDQPGTQQNTAQSQPRHQQQQSPIFIQWLDCVFQIMQQYPSAFEFTPAVLEVLAVHAYSCCFGTFLFDCSKEREEANVHARTSSLWNAFMRNKALFALMSNRPVDDHSVMAPLMVNPSNVIVWAAYWLRYHPIGLNSLAQNTFGLS